MANQYNPQEFLELQNGHSLQLRPTNCKRFGLEPFRTSTTDFLCGAKNGECDWLGFFPETVDGE